MSFQSLGQPSNTIAGTVANQPTGSIALSNLAAGAEATYTITNSLLVAGVSQLFITVYNQGGDATANVSMCADVRSISTGSAVVHVKNNGAGNAAGTWALFYFIAD